VNNAGIFNRGLSYDHIDYLSVWIQLTGFNNRGKEVDIDCKLALLFNPETKVLEEIFHWINP
jgi:hypothetical protein